MFSLNDKRGKRRRIIFGEAQIDPQYGVVLAAMDFEWTCRRAILALSKKPTVVLYEKFIKDYSAFGGLERAWTSEVLPSVKDACNLRDLMNKKMRWEWVCDAMLCRNVIVHGTESRVSDKESRWAVCVLEDACDAVVAYVEEQGKDIFKSINRRRSKKEIDKVSNDGKKLKAWHERVGKQIAKYGEHHWIREGMIF
ncbi:MAG: hypothetical protein IKO81_00045 [Bacteroidales bacterium]|nr:hypothetical protein [Bacteroidales bacterium]